MSVVAPDIEWLTTGDAAKILGRSPDTVRRMCDRGAFDGAYQPRAGDHWRIPLEAVLRFVEAVRPVRRTG